MPPEPEALQRTALPTGTVTFLFTDIEGSTQRWEQHREAMKAAVARHEQLLTAAMQQHGGYVFKTVGDAFYAAFATAPEALLAAVDAQRSLAKEDFSSVDGLTVRMGLHTGNAEERNADYFGPAVNRVARLMSVGYGGQVLLSDVTRGLAHVDLPNGTTLVDLGAHRLKDLTEPEQVWQLSIEGLPATCFSSTLLKAGSLRSYERGSLPRNPSY
jgi:class 3 adenylate cyclase